MENAEWIVAEGGREPEAPEGAAPFRRRREALDRYCRLVRPEGRSADPPPPGGVVLVSHDQILGRAWARIYPVRERRLLE